MYVHTYVRTYMHAYECIFHVPVVANYSHQDELQCFPAIPTYVYHVLMCVYSLCII